MCLIFQVQVLYIFKLINGGDISIHPSTLTSLYTETDVQIHLHAQLPPRPN